MERIIRNVTKKGRRSVFSIFMALIMVLSIISPGQGMGTVHAEDSGDLSNFVVSVKISNTHNAVVYDSDAESNDPAKTGVKYNFTAEFQESPDYQILDELEYVLPAGLSDLTPSGSIDITVTRLGEVYVVHDNTFEIIDGILYIHINTTDENYSRLGEAENANLKVSFSGTIDEGTKELDWGKDIVTNVNPGEPSVTIEKSGTYDSSTGKAKYTVAVKSVGDNYNVEVRDTLLGSALSIEDQDSFHLDNGGYIEGYGSTNILKIGDEDLYSFYNNKDHYEVSEDGFTLTIPEMRDGDVIVFEYYVNVDAEGMEGAGTEDETENEISVKSDNDTTPVTASCSLEGKVKFAPLSKDAS